MDYTHPLRTLLSASDFARVERLAVESGDPVDVVATQLELCSEVQLLRGFSDMAGVPIVRAGSFPDAPILETEINSLFLKHARMIPLSARRAK